MRTYSPEDMQEATDFELLKEVDHRQIKGFILEQMYEPTKWLRLYGIYQVAMIFLFLVLLGFALQKAFNGNLSPLWWILGALVFSVTVLVVLHEAMHALVYWIYGARKLTVGAIWRKFIFYIAADRQVVDYAVFKKVALAPFVVVNVLTIIPGVLLWPQPVAGFFLSIMCIHSLFCAGDVAMLSFYAKHSDKTIYNFDDLSRGKTFFYAKKN
ncbi:DUF3267 domain-containing protein [Mangrovibacterium diazotrophicum]|uniref:Putative zincin peptidase n=1 Tax=Mangrovibacterium diazotrophicum TaxID=1261403 RepID=A0A419WAW8_9BACT|nr:DUF3267 domain-containing protein [Mangrovibacterium diazotrophicum]RKD92631.1 putative zincin peptidase [Mangrovibacterium diazotrophicum]